MKNLIAIFMMLVLITASGCWWTTNESSQGGIASGDKEFSITVPSSSTVKQGQEVTITVTLNRGDYFKQDVQLDLKADGISIMPKHILVKASDRPDVQVKITADKNAALGDYRASVKGTPSTGQATSAEFTLKVVVP